MLWLEHTMPEHSFRGTKRILAYGRRQLELEPGGGGRARCCVSVVEVLSKGNFQGS